MRVQIPAYADMWMRGDRYGEVVKTFWQRAPGKKFIRREIAHVRLDKSGKTVRVILDDCTPV